MESDIKKLNITQEELEVLEQKLFSPMFDKVTDELQMASGQHKDLILCMQAYWVAAYAYANTSFMQTLLNEMGGEDAYAMIDTMFSGSMLSGEHLEFYDSGVGVLSCVGEAIPYFAYEKSECEGAVDFGQVDYEWIRETFINPVITDITVENGRWTEVALALLVRFITAINHAAFSRPSANPEEEFSGRIPSIDTFQEFYGIPLNELSRSEFYAEVVEVISGTTLASAANRDAYVSNENLFVVNDEITFEEVSADEDNADRKPMSGAAAALMGNNM